MIMKKIFGSWKCVNNLSKSCFILKRKNLFHVVATADNHFLDAPCSRHKSLSKLSYDSTDTFKDFSKIPASASVMSNDPDVLLRRILIISGHLKSRGSLVRTRQAAPANFARMAMDCGTCSLFFFFLKNSQCFGLLSLENNDNLI